MKQTEIKLRHVEPFRIKIEVPHYYFLDLCEIEFMSNPHTSDGLLSTATRNKNNCLAGGEK